jgi:hypothetical protein
LRLSTAKLLCARQKVTDAVNVERPSDSPLRLSHARPVDGFRTTTEGRRQDA